MINDKGTDMNKYDLDCTPSEGFDYITKNGKTARCSEILVDILVLQSQLKKSQERERKLEQLLLLTDDTVSHYQMDELQEIQWREYIEFCEAKGLDQQEGERGK